METKSNLSENTQKEIPENMPSIQIHYEKNPMYRTIFADGAVGGIAPTNLVNLSFYATRNAIPKSIIHNVSDDGVLDDGNVSDDSKAGFIREIEIGVYMTKQTAKDLYNFLKNIIIDDEK